MSLSRDEPRVLGQDPAWTSGRIGDTQALRCLKQTTDCSRDDGGSSRALEDTWSPRVCGAGRKGRGVAAGGGAVAEGGEDCGDWERGRGGVGNLLGTAGTQKVRTKVRQWALVRICYRKSEGANHLLGSYAGGLEIEQALPDSLARGLSEDAAGAERPRTLG